MKAPLKSDGAALKERAPGSFGLGVAIEKFEPEVKIGLDLEVILTQSDKIGQGEDRIGSQVVNP